MTKQQKRTIDREFYRYKANKEAGGRSIREYAYSRIAVNYESDRVCGSGMNGTENGVIGAIDRDFAASLRAAKWALVFEKTMDRFRWTNKDKLMRMKYLEGKAVYPICFALHIDRRTYFYWLAEIREIALQWALTLNISFQN